MRESAALAGPVSAASFRQALANLASLGRGARTHDGVVGAERFGVSVLEERQAWIAERFARPAVDQLHASFR